MVSRVNWDFNRLSRNPNSNEKDTIDANWHGVVDLEAMLGWHLMHTYVFYCNVLEMYPKATWVIEILRMMMMSQKAIMPWTSF